MKKKFLTGLILSFILFSSCAYASDWTGYFSVDWEDVKGIFKSEKIKSDDILPDSIASDWDKLTGKLTDALNLRDKNDSLPKSSWIPFKEDQISNTKKINKLLESALKILAGGEAGDLRREATELRDLISRKKIELDELRNKKIHAPEKSYMFWAMTKEKADKKISELENEIANDSQRLKDINSKLTETLKNIGLELEPSQTEILLNSVTGDDILQNTVIFSNVKKVVEKLEQLSQNETNTLDITRRYTGMYLVLNDLLIHIQEELIANIDFDYKPKLELIKSEAENLRKDALSKSSNEIYSEAQRNAFISNVRSNEITIQVTNLYEELLNSQKLATQNSIKTLKLNRDLAENTYRTVRSSGELRGLIKSGLEVFDAVDTLTMPELKIFKTGTLRLEFEEINRRLKK